MYWATPRKFLAAMALASAVVAAPLASAPALAQSSSIRYVVNGQAVTSGEIQRRVAFLKLQRKKGNLNAMAAEEMVNQELQRQEIARLRINISDDRVNDAFANFAKSNKMTAAQLTQVLNQSGVSAKHFKAYIKAQMGWGQALGAKARGGAGNKRMTEQEMVRKMLERGGEKPSATEYMLQQVIFVVPAKERGAILAKRKREAEAMRSRFTGCDTTREFAKGLVDVTVRDLGRFLEPELPTDWADTIKAARQGSATPVRETEKGVEFIGICRAREVSDDRVATIMFQMEGQNQGGGQGEELSKKFTQELRDKAKIVER